MAGTLRELARLAGMPGIRKELADLAKQYDRRGDHFDCRSRQGTSAPRLPRANSRAFRRGGIRMRHRTAHLGRRLVLTQAFVNNLAQQVVVGPGEILDLGDQFGPHPMHAAEDERRSEAGGARRRHLERHPGGGQRLQAAPQAFKLRVVDAGAGSAGIDQPPIRIVVGDQQRSEPGPAAFGIGPADHEGKSEPQQFCGFHEPGEVPSGLDNGLILDSLSRAASAPAAYLK
jgi:hypothetical protein